jgi:hypothetical protein
MVTRREEHRLGGELSEQAAQEVRCIRTVPIVLEQVSRDAEHVNSGLTGSLHGVPQSITDRLPQPTAKVRAGPRERLIQVHIRN